MVVAREADAQEAKDKEVDLVDTEWEDLLDFRDQDSRADLAWHGLEWAATADKAASLAVKEDREEWAAEWEIGLTWAVRSADQPCIVALRSRRPRVAATAASPRSALSAERNDWRRCYTSKV